MRLVPEDTRRRLPVLLLALLVLLLVLTSLEKRLTYDEPHNLGYGYRFLVLGPAHWEYGRSPLFALSALGCLATDCDRAGLDASEIGRLLVRAPTMAFAVALGFLVWLWLGETLGPAAARFGLILYVLNPTVLAHGKQVNGDMAVAFFTVAALYAGWRFSQRRGWRPFLAAVVATAGAALTKYTSVYLILLLPALVALSSPQQAPPQGRPRRLLVGLGLAVAFVVGVWIVVNAAYVFEGTFTPARSVPFSSQTARALAASNLPLPMPTALALSMDSVLDANEKPHWGPNYVLGRHNWSGVWYAFPLMVLLKTPLAAFVLVGLALGRGAKTWPRPFWRFWLVPGLVHLAFFSLLVAPQNGVRYVLPTVVLLVLVAASAAAPAARPRSVMLLVLGGWYAVSSLSYLPHPMCYFNELIGRRIHAYRFLADSNLDWEDRRAAIARFERRHPDLQIDVEPPRPHPGYILLGANRLLGISSSDAFRPLRRLDPVDHVGYSFLLFHVRSEDLRPRRRPPSSDGGR